MWTHWTPICSEETQVKMGAEAERKSPRCGAGKEEDKQDPDTSTAWASWSRGALSCLPRAYYLKPYPNAINIKD